MCHLENLYPLIATKAELAESAQRVHAYLIAHHRPVRLSVRAYRTLLALPSFAEVAQTSWLDAIVCQSSHEVARLFANEFALRAEGQTCVYPLLTAGMANDIMQAFAGCHLLDEKPLTPDLVVNTPLFIIPTFKQDDFLTLYKAWFAEDCELRGDGTLILEFNPSDTWGLYTTLMQDMNLDYLQKKHGLFCVPLELLHNVFYYHQRMGDLAFYGVVDKAMQCGASHPDTAVMALVPFLNAFHVAHACS